MCILQLLQSQWQVLVHSFAADQEIIDFMKYNMRSQMFAKSLQMQLVVGALKRLDMLRTMPELER